MFSIGGLGSGEAEVRQKEGFGRVLFFFGLGLGLGVCRVVFQILSRKVQGASECLCESGQRPKGGVSKGGGEERRGSVKLDNNKE